MRMRMKFHYWALTVLTGLSIGYSQVKGAEVPQNITLTDSAENKFEVSDKITLISSDNVSFEVETNLIRSAMTVVDMLSDMKNETEAPVVYLPIISSATLSEVIELLKSPWSYIDKVIGIKNFCPLSQLIEIALAVEYLNIQHPWHDRIVEFVANETLPLFVKVSQKSPLNLSRMDPTAFEEILKGCLPTMGIDKALDSHKLFMKLAQVFRQLIFSQIDIDTETLSEDELSFLD